MLNKLGQKDKRKTPTLI